MGKFNKKKKIIFLLTSLFAIILGLGFYGYFKILNTNLIYDNVKIEEFDIAHMTKEEALKFIRDKKEKELSKKNMVLQYEDKEYNINLKQLGFHYDYSKAVDKAYSIGREGNVFKRIAEIIRIKKAGIEINLDSDYEEKKINNIVSSIEQEINREMKDAEFDFNGGNIKISDEVIGRKVNKEELNKMIAKNIDFLEPIEIPVEKLQPIKTKELLSRINGVIGEFSTSFKGSSAGRIENIRISSKSLSKKVIMPGETISFNETTGPREKKFGYKEANIILAGEFTPGVGGGVCQTSTTLYNSLLLSNITILERSPHSIPAKYVKFGQDAAVAYGILDLKFRNDFDFPIYIHSRIAGDRIHIYIYGDKNAKDYTVKIESETIETIPPGEETRVDKNMAPHTKEIIQQGRTGYRVNTYKSIIKNGKVINKELITKDFYKPRDYIYKIGDTSVDAFTNKNDAEDYVEDYDEDYMEDIDYDEDYMEDIDLDD